MKMVSLKHHRYGGRLLSPGDEFTAGLRDCRLLSALGRAQKVVEVPAIEAPPVINIVASTPRYVIRDYPPVDTSDEGVEPESEPTSEEAPVRVKRKYKRRDMTAGD